MRFYDPKDEADLARVEAILKKGGVEFFVSERPEQGMAREIEVAEEDVPMAEELLLREKTKTK